MENEIFSISKNELKKIIIEAHKTLKNGRNSNIPDELLADTIIDKIKIKLQMVKN